MSTLRDMDNTLTDPVRSVHVKIRAKFMHEKTEIFEPTVFYNHMNTMHWTYLPALFIRFLTDVFGKRNPCCSESRQQRSSGRLHMERTPERKSAAQRGSGKGNILSSTIARPCQKTSGLLFVRRRQPGPS